MTIKGNYKHPEWVKLKMSLSHKGKKTRPHTEEEKRKISLTLRKNIPWNKGHKKERIQNKCKFCNQMFTIRKVCTENWCKNCLSKKLSENAYKSKRGGHTSRNIFYYKKDNIMVKLQSSYEVIVAKELENNNIKWERPNSILWKDENNQIHRYYPDFYLLDYNIYLDPKNILGLENEKKNHKIEKVCNQNNINVIILNKNELTWNIIKDKIIGLLA